VVRVEERHQNTGRAGDWVVAGRLPHRDVRGAQHPQQCEERGPLGGQERGDAASMFQARDAPAVDSGELIIGRHYSIRHGL
jgi:hypothetical protein